MDDDAKSWLGEMLSLYQRVMDYPLFTLGERPFLVSQLVVLLMMVAAVFIFEFITRRYLLLRLLRRTRMQPSLQYVIGRLVG